MGYVGAKTIDASHVPGEFVRISGADLCKSDAHDLMHGVTINARAQI